MTKANRTGPQWSAGDHAPFRDDLVSWPSETTPNPQAAAPVVVLPEAPDLAAELARTKDEVRRLLARIQELVEENEQLRRSTGHRLTVI